MKYTLIVKNAPYRSQASDSAWQFAQALLRCEHQIIQVFFYFDGVFNALDQAEPPQDERDVIARWQTLAQTQKVPLLVCSTAAARRAVTAPLAQGFQSASLMQFSQAVADSDRVISFGAKT